MRVVGGSENHGPEQERLNSVVGAPLRITTSRATAGPAVELLEYLTPRDGRPYPVDAQANDLVPWHTIVTTSSPEAVYRALLAGRYPLVSPRVVTLPDGPLGSREAFLAGSERPVRRSEEHTSELQSPCNLVCRLLLEKKKKSTEVC